MNKDTAAGLGLIAIAIAYWLGTNAIPHSVLAGEVRADGLPKLLAWGLGVLGLVLVAQGLLWRARPAPAEAAAADAPVQARSWYPHWYSHWRALGMIAFAAGYIIAVPTLGYTITIALLLAAVALYNGAARSPRVLLLAVLGAALFYVLFVHVLKVPLPPGIWPELIG
jgi:putative tricarboxylic transport membrane protein